MSFVDKIIALLFCVGLFSEAYPQAGSLDWLINTQGIEGKNAIGEHPRGLIKASELEKIRERVTYSPFLEILEKLERDTQSLTEEVRSTEEFEAQKVTELAAHYSYLYLLKGDEAYADSAYSHLESVFEDQVVFDNPVSRGLTRAAVLLKMGFAYDFCYQAWTQEQRNQVNRQLYKLIYATSANMGYEANYSLVSNWMGVRWGSVIFASLIWDHPDPETPSLVNPLLWDASKRLSDHLAKNIHPQGWPAESLGYHVYNWSFVGPAAIAWKNQRDRSLLEDLAPQMIPTLPALASGTVAIPTLNDNIGIKPDLSDDGLNLGEGVFSMALRVYPEEQHPYIKWMHDYVKESALYSLLYYPEEVPSKNPEEVNWQTFTDSTHGVLVHRNTFKDKNDIVAVINASQERVAGHKGPDVNTFRIIGMGVPLVIGGGRTNLIAGQSNLFPDKVSPEQKGDLKEAGEMLTCGFTPDGSGMAIVKGSSTGVEGHIRKWISNYSAESGAEAVFVIRDKSSNGKTWRINTPSFNEVEIVDQSFTLTTPEGHTLKAIILSEGHQGTKINTGQLRYGGQTQRHNTGIQYDGKRHVNSRYVDVEIDNEITVVMTLQRRGNSHPEINQIGHEEIVVGNLTLDLSFNSN
jgi:hypothetical protein